MSKTQPTATKLSDTQLVILGAAAQRNDGSLFPFAQSLTVKGAALAKVIESLWPGFRRWKRRHRACPSLPTPSSSCSVPPRNAWTAPLNCPRISMAPPHSETNGHPATPASH